MGSDTGKLEAAELGGAGVAELPVLGAGGDGADLARHGDLRAEGGSCR